MDHSGTAGRRGDDLYGLRPQACGQDRDRIGYNVFDVRRSDAMDYGFGEIVKTGEQTNIASTQIHFNMQAAICFAFGTSRNTKKSRHRPPA